MPFLIGIAIAGIGVAVFIREWRRQTRRHCSFCGTKSVVVDGEFCSTACKDKLADELDADRR